MNGVGGSSSSIAAMGAGAASERQDASLLAELNGRLLPQ